MLQEQQGKTSGLGPALPALGHALAGSVATAGAKALLYPLNLVVTRLQVQKQLRGKDEAESAAKNADTEYSSILDAAKKIYRTEGGLSAFYTGCLPDIGKGITDSFLFFLAYNFLRQYAIKRNDGNRLSVSKELSVGIAAGSFAKFFTTPIENIVTRQQTAAMVAARAPDASNTPASADNITVADTARRIHNENGLAGFWAGYSESILLTTNPALTFAVDNILTRLLPKSRRDNQTPQLTFIIAALSKAIATTITYPAMLAKSRAQVIGHQPEEDSAAAAATPAYLEKPNMNSTPRRRAAKNSLKKLSWLFKANYAIVLTLKKIFRTEGLAGLYSGIEGEVVKGFLSHGLTMMMKERVHVGVIQLYYLLLRLTQSMPAEFQKVQQGASAVAADVQERASHVGETVSEGARSVVEKAGGSEAQRTAENVVSEARQRVGNVSVTVAEGAKSMMGRTNVTETAQQTVNDVAAEAQERASNLADTVSEGAKQAIEKAKGSE